MAKVLIVWLQPERDCGKEEVVSSSRIKSKQYAVGDEVKVKYRSTFYKAQVKRMPGGKSNVRRSNEDLSLSKISKPVTIDTVIDSTANSPPPTPTIEQSTFNSILELLHTIRHDQMKMMSDIQKIKADVRLINENPHHME
ncbi:uncharacterized protein LOC100375053 [Saccoglossus kowalevskii]|uniref:Uncharacterized protein LOC100375053 n=1 Tax=Saccoglossus kowalevskii TaxID=10224 RepID=A0ABM0GI91_SACKO|nr:PREDICTED: uncharacterized protein LOC100375053 [Saccoglossus kowalevskii]